MSEAELREGLRAAVGDEPPLDFDPDALIARARHARKRRRALVAVAVATLALTGTALSLPGALDRRPLLDAAAGPLLTTAASPPPTGRPPAPTALPPTTTPEAPTPRSGPEGLLARRVTDLLARVAPGAEVVAVDFDDKDQQGARFISGLVQYVDAEGSSGIAVQITGAGVGPDPDRFCASATCVSTSTRPDGSRVEVAVADGGPEGTTVLTAAHFRLDGTVVQVNAYNYDPAKGGALRATVPLSVDQLVELAVDPGLALL
ncbi:hypothetical protein [Saccharothrix sp. Mg75]|uniref:hypothetical protein n=1 Tax=Saccharothrix sp. Mg75 TaxID=3445357 RepID=UPI003EEADD98